MAMKTDTINIEITPEGLIKIDTDGISQPNHATAEAFLRALQTLAGGTTDVKHKAGSKGHSHAHSHGNQSHQH